VRRSVDALVILSYIPSERPEGSVPAFTVSGSTIVGRRLIEKNDSKGDDCGAAKEGNDSEEEDEEERYRADKRGDQYEEHAQEMEEVDDSESDDLDMDIDWLTARDLVQRVRLWLPSIDIAVG
jgi:hypothetical protein